VLFRVPGVGEEAIKNAVLASNGRAVHSIVRHSNFVDFTVVGIHLASMAGETPAATMALHAEQSVRGTLGKRDEDTGHRGALLNSMSGFRAQTRDTMRMRPKTNV